MQSEHVLFLHKEPEMTNKNTQSDVDPGSGLPLPIEPGTTDLGDDVYRGDDNSGSTLGSTQRSADVDPGSGLPIRIDPGVTDLGDDAERSV